MFSADQPPDDKMLDYRTAFVKLAEPTYKNLPANVVDLINSVRQTTPVSAQPLSMSIPTIADDEFAEFEAVPTATLAASARVTGCYVWWKYMSELQKYNETRADMRGGKPIPDVPLMYFVDYADQTLRRLAGLAATRPHKVRGVFPWIADGMLHIEVETHRERSGKFVYPAVVVVGLGTPINVKHCASAPFPHYPGDDAYHTILDRYFTQAVSVAMQLRSLRPQTGTMAKFMNLEAYFIDRKPKR